MKKRTLWIVVALLALALPSATLGQEENRFLAMSVVDVAQTWLLRNCGIDDEPLLELAIARNAEELAPLFLSAWEEGPAQELVREVREGARGRFDRNRATLQDAEGLGLSAEDAERAAARSADDFVDRAVKSFEVGYRSQALRGLYLVGGEEGRQLVEQVAGGEESAFKEIARLVLERSGAETED